MLWLHLIIQCSPCFSFTSPIPAGLPKILLLSIWNPSQNHHHSKGVCGARWGAVKTTLHITNFEYKSWLKIYGNQLVTTNNSSMTVAAWSESFSTLLSSFQHRAGSGWDRDHRGAWACEEAVSGWRFSKMAWWLLGQKPFDKDVWGEKTKDSTKNQKQGGQLTPTVSKKRPLSKDLSTWMHGLDTLPIDDEIIAEVPILNCKAGAGVKLSTMPTLCLSKKTGIYVKNQTGHEVPYYFQLVTVLFALTSHQS